MANLELKRSELSWTHYLIAVKNGKRKCQLFYM